MNRWFAKVRNSHIMTCQTIVNSFMTTHPTKSTIKIIAALVSLVMPMIAPAAVVNLIGSDSSGSTSFSTGLNWAGGLAPSAGNDYNTAGFLLRTPGDNTNNETWTFQGGSLTLGPVNLVGGINGSMLEKFGQNVVGDTRTLVINNFTNQANAMLRSGSTAPEPLCSISGKPLHHRRHIRLFKQTRPSSLLTPRCWAATA